MRIANPTSRRLIAPVMGVFDLLGGIRSDERWSIFARATLVFGLALTTPTFAESSDSSTSSGQSPQAAEMQSLATGINNTEKALGNQQQAAANQAKQMIQQQAQDADNKARRQQQAAAAALAGVGAAIAGAGCLMLMRQAMKEEDPQQRNMLMAMAMQQCSQAAQSAANAAKNDSGQQTMASNDNGQTPAPMDTMTPPTATSAPTWEPLAYETPSPTPDNQLADGNQGQDPSTFDATGTPSTLDTSNNAVVASADAKSTLAPIPDNNTTYDENAKAGAPAADASPTPGGGLGGASVASFGGKGATTEDALSKLTASLSRTDHGKGTTDAGEASAGGPDGAGASASPTGGGGEGAEKDGNMSSMLAGMMGGQGGAGVQMGGPREDVIFWRPAKGGAAVSGQRPPNIFQYASYRMKKLSKEDAVLPRGDKRLARAPAAGAGTKGVPARAPRNPVSLPAHAPPTAARKPAGPLLAVKP